MTNQSSIEKPAASQQRAQPATAAAGEAGIEHTIVKRSDGVYLHPAMFGSSFQQAVSNLFLSDAFFTELNYPVFLKALYDYGPELPHAASPDALIRFAADIVPFSPERRSLYKAVKFRQGQAEYFFEPVYLQNPADPSGAGTPTRLNIDEFIADLWTKGVRFGINLAAVRAAIAAGKTERVLVAEQLAALPGTDANIVEVSGDLHRSDAPRVLAGGKLDLMAFQNRFPQIKKGMRLLKKVPRKIGSIGFELSGLVIEPALPKDIDLHALAGLGTCVENTAEGEFLVSQQGGFLNVDSKSQQLSIADKIVSRDGVSARTTGNLLLSGDYEEFGEVQEKRVIEGGNLTLHADVFGNLISRGGNIVLDANLVSASAHNADGDILIKGVASGSVLQTKHGEITMQRAESCIISATRVVIEHAVNCEIMADEVLIQHAEGCAIAARKIMIETAGPRKQSEMLVFALLPDTSKLDQEIAQLQAKAEQTEVLLAKHQNDINALTSLAEVRQYLVLTTKIRNKELVLTPEQAPALQKMAMAAAPTLKAVGQLSVMQKTLAAEKQSILDQVAELLLKKQASAANASIKLHMLTGDSMVRSMKFNPAGTPAYQHAAKDIKSMLRGAASSGEQLFSGSCGPFEWQL